MGDDLLATAPFGPAELRRRLLALLVPAAAGDETVVQAALAAYENARADGLCHEGAWECALESVVRSRSHDDFQDSHV